MKLLTEKTNQEIVPVMYGNRPCNERETKFTLQLLFTCCSFPTTLLPTQIIRLHTLIKCTVLTLHCVNSKIKEETHYLTERVGVERILLFHLICPRNPVVRF